MAEGRWEVGVGVSVVFFDDGIGGLDEVRGELGADIGEGNLVNFVCGV